MQLTRRPTQGDDPNLWRLLETANLMRGSGVELLATPDRGRIDVVGKLPDWAIDCLELHYDHLVYWWRHSPCAIIVCDSCGEWRMTGGTSSKGKSCSNGGPNRLTAQQKKMRMQLVNPTWGCQGTYRLLEIPWATNRPRRRRVKCSGSQ